MQLLKTAVFCVLLNFKIDKANGIHNYQRIHEVNLLRMNIVHCVNMTHINAKNRKYFIVLSAECRKWQSRNNILATVFLPVYVFL